MNQTDLSKLADRARRLADLLDTRGEKALTVAAQWRATPPPHLTAERGGTGDFDARDKADRLDPHRHARILANIGRFDADTATLTALILDTVPTAQRVPPDEGPGEGWCSSCWRIRFLSPEHTHSDGRVKHKALCSWCASFKAENGQLPPETLLRKRRDGKKITQAQVDEALGKRRAS